MPSVSIPKHKRELLKNLSHEVRHALSGRFPGEIISDRGVYTMAQRSLDTFSAVAGLVSKIGSFPEIINLPDTTEREKEFLSLGRLLIDALHDNRGRIRFFVPVCPNYSQESSITFYQTIGVGISPQAHAAIRASEFIRQTFPEYGFEPKVKILVADTEDDIPEVMERCVDGDSQVYKNRCFSSVRAIQDELNDVENISVTTFSLGLGDQFRQTQYRYEDIIRGLRSLDPKFGQEIEKMGGLRRERHSKILGRSEIDYELTIRYMAQYAALGTLTRRSGEPTILLNYPTPNLPFYNAAVFKNPQFSLSEDDLRVVPILETVL